MHSDAINWAQLIDDGVAAIPLTFRARINNVALLLEDEPSAEVRRQEGLTDDETLLGLYHGIPLPLRGEGYGIGETLPDTITLYKKPILEEGGDNPLEIARVVRETIWHEFGHYLGLDEDEVRAREVRRDIVSAVNNK